MLYQALKFYVILIKFLAIRFIRVLVHYDDAPRKLSKLIQSSQVICNIRVLDKQIPVEHDERNFLQVTTVVEQGT